MEFEPEFIPVLYAMVDPDLKLVVRPSFQRTDGREAGIAVTYDPEIGPGQLTVPATAAEQARWAKWDSTPAPPRLFESSQAQSVVRINLDLHDEEGDLKLLVTSERDHFRLKSLLIEKAHIHGVTGHSYELLYSVLMAALVLPAWDREATQSRPMSMNRIGLYLKKSTALLLAENSSFRFDPNTEGDVLVAQRKVRP